MTLDSEFFVSPNLHEKTVELPNGSKHVLHFLELPSQEFIQYRSEVASADPEISKMATPRLIAKSLRNPDGSPAMDDAHAAKLKPAAATALLAAIMEVNAFQAKKA